MANEATVKSAWDMTESDWAEMSKRVDAASINQDDFKRLNKDNQELEQRIRAFDNPSNEDTLRVVVD